MARRRQRAGGKPVPAWLLGDWRDRPAGETVAYCRRHGIPLVTVIRYRAACKGGVRLRRVELAEIATWVIVEEP